jgi:uncharacterized membrane protein YoaK (UPF0700 family)
VSSSGSQPVSAPASPADALRRSQSAARSIRHPLTRTLLALTFTTGIVDAVSYLGLGRVFSANMTGNIVLLGFGIAGSGHLPVVAPIVSLFAFLCGSGLGGALSSRLASRHNRHVAAALAIEVSLLAAAAIFAAFVTPRAGRASADAIIAALALAMGIRTATVRKLGVPDVTTVVLTLTLTALAAESRPAGGSGKGSTRRTGAVVGMLAGAVAGALLLKSSAALALAVATVIPLLAGLMYLPAARR